MQRFVIGSFSTLGRHLVIKHDKLHARCSLLFGESMSPKFSAGSDIWSRTACKLAAVSEICSHLQTQRSWARKQVDLHGTSSRPEDLGRAAWKIPGETHTKNPKRKNSPRMRHTVRVPDLRILGASPERSSGETHTKTSKRKLIANAAHGPSSRVDS